MLIESHSRDNGKLEGFVCCIYMSVVGGEDPAQRIHSLATGL